MKKKKNLIILSALFITFILGAYFLYNNLSETYRPDSLVVKNDTSAVSNSTNTKENVTIKDSSNESDKENQNEYSDNNTGKDSSNNTGSNTDSDNNPGKEQQTDSSNNTNPNTDSVTSSNNKNQNNHSEDSTVQTAPDFSVYDLEGNKVTLSDYFGKPIILNFWASWCGPCQMEMPDFDSAYAHYKNDISFLMINMTDGSRETTETASSFISEKGYMFPVYYDTDYDASIRYSVTSLPTTFFINEKGELIAQAKGAIDAQTLQKGIDLIFDAPHS